MVFSVLGGLEWRPRWNSRLSKNYTFDSLEMKKRNVTKPKLRLSCSSVGQRHWCASAQHIPSYNMGVDAIFSLFETKLIRLNIFFSYFVRVRLSYFLITASSLWSTWIFSCTCVCVKCLELEVAVCAIFRGDLRYRFIRSFLGVFFFFLQF